ARQAALGDTLCRLLATQGYSVTREFYYNDAGNQIDNLALSVQARGRGIAPDSPDFPADGYRGDYIAEIARSFAARDTIKAADGQAVTATGNLDDLDNIRRFAVACLRHEQDQDLQARSEERRVGKECGARRDGTHDKDADGEWVVERELN